MTPNNDVLNIIACYVPNDVLDFNDVNTLRCVADTANARANSIETGLNLMHIKNAYDKLMKEGVTHESLCEFLPLENLPIQPVLLRKAARYGIKTVGEFIYGYNRLFYTKAEEIRQIIIRSGLTDNSGKISIIDTFRLSDECPKLFLYIQLAAERRLISSQSILSYQGRTEEQLVSLRSIGEKTAKILFKALDAIGFVENKRISFPVYQKGPLGKIFFDIDRINKIMENVPLPSPEEYRNGTLRNLRVKYRIGETKIKSRSN